MFCPHCSLMRCRAYNLRFNLIGIQIMLSLVQPSFHQVSPEWPNTKHARALTKHMNSACAQFCCVQFVALI